MFERNMENVASLCQTTFISVGLTMIIKTPSQSLFQGRLIYYAKVIVCRYLYDVNEKIDVTSYFTKVIYVLINHVLLT